MRLRALMFLAAISVLDVPAPGAEPVPAADKPAALDQAFDKLKSLVGQWEVVSMSKEVPAGSVTYRLTGGGSAVMETLFAGSDMEMVSIYHRDGKDLLMTHYCCAGNQPKFKGRIDEKTGDLVFDFAGGTNFDAAKDMHIHEGRIRFTDKDQVASEWVYYVGGKKGGEHKLTLKRKP